MSAPKHRRRDPGQGGLYEYVTKSGEKRWYIKFSATPPGGTAATAFVRRKARPWAPPIVDRRTKEARPRAGQPFLLRHDALAELEQIRAELHDGTYFERLNPTPVERGLTTGEWLDKWLLHLDSLVKLNEMRRSTVASYRKNTRLHIKPAVGDIELQHLTAADITDMKANLLLAGRKDHRAGEGLSPRTVSYCGIILKAALTDAVQAGVLAANPADQEIRRGRGRRKSKPSTSDERPTWWTEQQLDQFLAWCAESDAPWAAAYAVVGFTGVREGELLALRWRDYIEADDAGKAKLTVRRTVDDDGYEDLPKNGQPRTVSLFPETVEVLNKWRLQRKKLGLAAKQQDGFTGPDARIFGRPDNNQYVRPKDFWARFKVKVRQCQSDLREKGIDEALIPHEIRVHDIRHTHGTTLYIRHGWPIKAVADRLGHDEVVLLRTYAHLDAGLQDELVERSVKHRSGA